MLKSVRDYTIIAISGLLAFIITPRLKDSPIFTKSFTEQTLSSPQTSTIITAATTAIFYYIFYFVIYSLKKSTRFRRYPGVEPRSRFEGRWLEEAFALPKAGSSNPPGEGPTRLYAIFYISYDASGENNYILKGTAYHGDGSYHSTWLSKRIHFDTSANTIEYFYDGSYHVEQNKVKGFGELSFNGLDSDVNSGMGSFLDYGLSTVRVSFSFRRITDEYFESVISNQISEEDRVDNPERIFVRNYLADRSNPGVNAARPEGARASGTT